MAAPDEVPPHDDVVLERLAAQKEEGGAARDEGKRIVPVCTMVGTVLKKHPEFDDITDPVTAEVTGWANTQPSS